MVLNEWILPHDAQLTREHPRHVTIVSCGESVDHALLGTLSQFDITASVASGDLEALDNSRLIDDADFVVIDAGLPTLEAEQIERIAVRLATLRRPPTILTANAELIDRLEMAGLPVRQVFPWDLYGLSSALTSTLPGCRSRQRARAVLV